MFRYISALPLTASSDTTVEESYPARVAVGCAYRPDDRSLLAFSMTWMKQGFSPVKANSATFLSVISDHLAP